MLEGYEKDAVERKFRKNVPLLCILFIIIDIALGLKIVL